MDSHESSIEPAGAPGLPKDDSLAGKTALVTGGGSGLGAAICGLLAASGARVTVADLKEDRAAAVANRLRDSGGEAHAAALDVSDAQSAERVVGAIVEGFGRLDVLVNNAGIDVTLPMSELSVADWNRVIGTNLSGPFLLARQASAHMKRAGGGHIVNIASTAAKRAWPNASAYHASKWGLLGLSHAMHAELRPHNIKVTAVIAGGMRTPFLLDRFPGIDVGTLQDPANVASAVKWVLLMPDETVIPEIMVLPMRESSWP
jgi:NAD(P)-dependent dehydrogenase (short-subunit alcohol dehydrogenase family)